MAESRYSAAAAYRMARCQFLGDAALAGNVYAALSMTEIADTDIPTEFLSALTWSEYDGTYTRQQITILDVVTGSSWRLRATGPTDFGTPGAPSASAKALVLYQGTTASPSGDGAAHVLGWIQGPDIFFFPFTGDGATPLVIPWPTGGTVILGPNCA